MTEEPDKRPVVPVHNCADDNEAEVVVSLLRGRDIESFPTSELPPEVFPLHGGPLGEVTIWVDEANRDRAIEIIKESRESND
jgi:hypothetical protein